MKYANWQQKEAIESMGIVDYFVDAIISSDYAQEIILKDLDKAIEGVINYAEGSGFEIDSSVAQKIAYKVFEKIWEH